MHRVALQTGQSDPAISEGAAVVACLASYLIIPVPWATVYVRPHGSLPAELRQSDLGRVIARLGEGGLVAFRRTTFHAMTFYFRADPQAQQGADLEFVRGAFAARNFMVH